MLVCTRIIHWQFELVWGCCILHCSECSHRASCSRCRHDHLIMVWYGFLGKGIGKPRLWGWGWNRLELRDGIASPFVNIDVPESVHCFLHYQLLINEVIEKSNISRICFQSLIKWIFIWILIKLKVYILDK